MFQTSVLASGSKGNCILIRSENTMLLLDAGLSGTRISGLLKSIDIDENKITALLISHEHNDHIRGAGIICRKLSIPLYSTELTYSACRKKIGKLPKGVKFFQNGDTIKIGDIEIKAFQSSHDVVDGSNFVFKKTGDNERKLAVATDIGYSSNLMIINLRESTTIILESNHDIKMLLEGPYPWFLKQRIKSRQGHLSNEQAVGVIIKVIHPGLENLVLAHLSEKNNLPQIAENLMKDYLNSINYNLNLVISSQYKATPLIDI